MKPYLTILLDSFRMLKSKAIFWVSLIITLLVAVLYLSLGFDEKGVTLFFGLTSFETELIRKGTPIAERLYLGIFTNYIAEIWLAWIAVLLGLISCGSLFPNAMKEGSSGMLLTKKPSRLGVFLAKFVGSLFFVAIQVVLFVLVVLIALRWRVGEWNFSIFWYVPLVLLVFTYLYSFMVLIAVKMRSMMTALILTLVLWGISSIVGSIEGSLYQFTQTDVYAVEVNTSEADNELEGLEDSQAADRWYARVKAIYGFLPKTGRTMEIADRLLIVNGKRGYNRGSMLDIMMGTDTQGESAMAEATTLAANRHSVAYAIGTSSVFALVMLSLAAWIFCRRDY